MQSHENLEEYLDPVAYDLENSGYEPQGSFYEGLAREFGSPVLAPASGTGRVAIPMARRGYRLTGLDLSPQMVERARAKGEGLPINWVVGDCRDFRLDEQFGLIFMTGHAFQHLLDRSSQEATLRAVHAHLLPDGAFAFETRHPSLSNLFEDQAEAHWYTYLHPELGQVEVSGWQHYDLLTQIQHYTTRRRWAQGERLSHIALRYTFPQELEALLHYNGFRLERLYGDWDGSPLTMESREIICVCRPV